MGMEISPRQLKNIVKQALAEEAQKGEWGIQPTVIPPLTGQYTQADSSIVTRDVVDSLLKYKRYKRVKEETIDTYQKRLHQFAKRFPTLPLETDVIMGYLDQFTGDTGRHKRNHHDVLNMLYKHAVEHFGVTDNPLDSLDRPTITHKQIRTLSLEEVRNVDAAVCTVTERAVWELTVGHGWRQVEVRRVTAGDVRAISGGLIWCRGKERDEYAPLLPETQQLLEQLAAGLLDGEPVIRSTRLRKGVTQPLGADGIAQLIQRLLGRVGVKYQGHDLRRTFCTLVTDARNGEESLAMRLARDKVPGQNDRYINTDPVKLRESLIRYSPLSLIRQVQTGESLVETGESRTPRPEEATQSMLQA